MSPGMMPRDSIERASTWAANAWLDTCSAVAVVRSWGSWAVSFLPRERARSCARSSTGTSRTSGGTGMNGRPSVGTEPEIVSVEEGAPEYVWKALRAACETGLRPGDLVRLSEVHVQMTPKGRRIQIRTLKKKRMASIPVTQKMAEIIDAAPKGTTILTDRDGQPWEAKRLAHAVTYWRDRLGLRRELRFYDARGSACTRLILAGASLGEVANCMGWSVKTAAQMIEVYAALDPAMADSVLVKLEQIRDAN